MSIEAVSISVPAAIIMGLAFGAGPCNITCLPYLGPVLLKNDRLSQSWRTVLPFSLGRMSGYALLGLAAGYAGQNLANWFESQLGVYLLGGATILIGVQFIRRRPSKTPCSIKHTKSVTVNLQPAAQVQQKPLMPGALFGMGAGMALNPCVPLTAVLAAAAASGSMFAGMGLGLAFGLGAVLIPTFVFAIAVAHFGVQLRTHLVAWRSQLELSAAGLLILLGTATVFGWIKP